MKQFLSWLGNKAANGVVTGLFLILTIVSVTYALNYNWSDPTSIRNQISGNPLTAAGWNLLVGNVDNLNERLLSAEGSGGIVPTGAIMAFNLITCPSGWSEADGINGRPDLRGEFIRGWNRNTTGTDGGRVFGSMQNGTRLHMSQNGVLRRNRFALESLGFFSKKSFNPLVPSQWTPAIAGVSRFAPRHRSTPAIQNTFLQKGLHSQPFFVKYFGSAGVH